MTARKPGRPKGSKTKRGSTKPVPRKTVWRERVIDPEVYRPRVRSIFKATPGVRCRLGTVRGETQADELIAVLKPEFENIEFTKDYDGRDLSAPATSSAP
jgi:hypothetical protein